MFKRIISLMLCLVLAVGLFPPVNALARAPITPESVDQCCHTLRVDVNDPDYYRPNLEGKLIEITPQRVADTFAYLDAHYVENHPEQALDFYTGTEEDRANLKKLAETITSGCKTDKDRADAIGKWLSGNIEYDVGTSAYASDTFYRRKGNCLSYANLMMFLLRSLGIPAVVGDGWRGDMKTMGVELFNMAGHAWVFVRLDDEWVLYDPLWLDGGTTDREYMAEHIYFDTVEFIIPVTDGDHLPPRTNELPVPYWTNGSYYLYSNLFPTGSGTLSYFVNNQAYIFVSNQCEPEGSQDGRLYIDGRDKTNMVMGELYRDGWVSYGEYHNEKSMAHTYAFPNGMMADGYTMEFDGKLWYMSYDSAMPILMDESDYWIQDGLVTMAPGYSGPWLGLRWQDGCMESSIGEVFLEYENCNPEVATIDDSGNITCHAEGYAEFHYKLQRRERNGNITLMGSAITSILVSTEDRTPDYRDLSSHDTHDMVLSHTVDPTCEGWGVHVYKCSGCPYTEERQGDPPLDHDYRYSHTTEPTCTEFGYNHYTCTRCGDSYASDEIDMLDHEYTQSVLVAPTCLEAGVSYYECIRCGDSFTSVDIPALGHAWNGTECDRCEVTRPTPFDDVRQGAFYEVPIAWAVENGITSGVGGSSFAPDRNCTRGQVVTFLWRAAGKPEPKSTSHPFIDVSESAFYYKAMLWAVENGVTSGMSATTFAPDAECTRGQVVTFLWRAKGKPEPVSTDCPFTDTSPTAFYYKAMLWAVQNSVTSGMGATTFAPNNICTRGQVVTFLYRAYQK